MAQFPNTEQADGIWTLKKVRRAILGENWPGSGPLSVTNIATTSTDTYSVPAGSPNGIFISDNGTKLYISSQGGTVEEYTLSTANDLTTISYETSKTLTGLDDGRLRGIFVDTTGTKLFIADYGSRDITEYTMSAFDLSTLNTTPTRQVNLNTIKPGGGIGATENMIFSRDGLRLYHYVEASGVIDQFNMSTAFDLTTLSSNSKTLSATTTARGIVITTNGDFIYVSDSGDNLIEYALATPFELDTASATGTTYQQTELEINAKYSFSNDMTKLYASNYGGSIHEFDVTLG